MAQQPTVKQLRYLCAVANSLHFSKAAKHCFVTQSTLSAGINELEETLGVRLLERNNKQVLITPVGKTIICRAQEILANIDALVEAAQQRATPFSQPLRMGVIPTIAPFLLPELLAQMRETYPQLQILLREGLSSQVIALLQQGELDLVLLALPYPIEGLEALHLFQDPFVVATHESHKFAHRKKIKLSELIDEEMLLLEDGHCLRDHALEACHLKLSQIRAPFQATSLHTVVQMVANRVGITLLPRMALEAGILRGLPVTTTELDADEVWRSIALVWRRNTPRAEEHRMIGEQVKITMDWQHTRKSPDGATRSSGN